MIWEERQFTVPRELVTPAVLQHQELLNDLNLLYAKKNHDYGDSFHQSFAEDGLLMAKIRLGDKYNRFVRLIKTAATITDESIRDTLLDLANYALMTVMELDRAQMAPVENDAD